MFFILFLLLTEGLFGYRYYMVLSAKIISPVPAIFEGNTINIFQNNSPLEKLKSELKKKNIPFSTVSVASDSAYIVRQPQGEEILLSSKKDLDVQVSSLHLILSRLTIEGKDFKRLDLRYDKPVIVFK